MGADNFISILEKSFFEVGLKDLKINQIAQKIHARHKSIIIPRIHETITAFQGYGISLSQWEKAITLLPHLVISKPEILVKHFEDSYALLNQYDISKKELLNAFLKVPSLFLYTPQKLHSNILETSNVLKEISPDISEKEYLKMCIVEPTLFHTRADTIKNNIEKIVSPFKQAGLTSAHFIAAAQKKPCLLYLAPHNIHYKMRKMILFYQKHEIPLSTCLAAYRGNPAFYYQKPETLQSNIMKVAEFFIKEGFQPKEYIEAISLKKSMLFSQDPNTILEHLNLIKQYHREGAFSLFNGENSFYNILKYILNRPIIMTYSSKNLALRQIYSKLKQTKQETPYMSILTDTKNEVVRYIQKHADAQSLKQLSVDYVYS